MRENGDQRLSLIVLLRVAVPPRLSFTISVTLAVSRRLTESPRLSERRLLAESLSLSLRDLPAASDLFACLNRTVFATPLGRTTLPVAVSVPARLEVTLTNTPRCLTTR